MNIRTGKNLLAGLAVTAALTVALGCAPPDPRLLGGPTDGSPKEVHTTAPQAITPYKSYEERDGDELAFRTTAPQALIPYKSYEERDGDELAVHTTAPVADAPHKQTEEPDVNWNTAPVAAHSVAPASRRGGGTDRLKEQGPTGPPEYGAVKSTAPVAIMQPQGVEGGGTEKQTEGAVAGQPQPQIQTEGQPQPQQVGRSAPDDLDLTVS